MANLDLVVKSLRTYGSKDVILINFALDSRKSLDDHAQNGDEDEELIAPGVHGSQFVVLGLGQDYPEILSCTFYSSSPRIREFS